MLGTSRRHPMRRFLLSGGALVLLTLCGCGRVRTCNPANIAEFRRLRAIAPESTRLVKIRGVVTFADYLSDFFVIEDETGGLPIYLSRGQTVTEVGKSVEVAGGFPDAASSDFFQESRVTVLGDQALPKALPIRAPGLGGAQALYRRVALDGVVSAAELTRPGLGSLVVKADGADVPVNAVLGGAEYVEGLVGARVRVTGVLLRDVKGARPRLEIWTHSFDDLHVLQAAHRAPTLVPSAHPLSEVRSAREVHRLSAEEAARRHPVELNAVVTYFDRSLNVLFVQDETDGTFVRLGLGGVPALRAGDLIRVTGLTHPGQFAPIVTSAHVTVIGSAPLPEPQYDMEAAFMGERDSEWVQLRGVVQSVEPASSTVVATMVWGQHSFKAHIQAPLSQVSALVDREVSIRGVCGPVFNPNRQGLGIGIGRPECRIFLRSVHGLPIRSSSRSGRRQACCSFRECSTFNIGRGFGAK